MNGCTQLGSGVLFHCVALLMRLSVITPSATQQLSDEDIAALAAISRSRTEPASRVERARMLLSYREDSSFFAVGRTMGVHHQTVQRCVERALAYGPMAALEDLPRPGKQPTITAEAKAWVVNPACRKAKELGYPHELWTTRLLARHVREHAPAAGHICLARLAQALCATSSMSRR
jgi:Homeodomain-like domain